MSSRTIGSVSNGTSVGGIRRSSPGTSDSPHRVALGSTRQNDSGWFPARNIHEHPERRASQVAHLSIEAFASPNNAVAVLRDSVAVFECGGKAMFYGSHWMQLA